MPDQTRRQVIETLVPGIGELLRLERARARAAVIGELITLLSAMQVKTLEEAITEVEGRGEVSRVEPRVSRH